MKSDLITLDYSLNGTVFKLNHSKHLAVENGTNVDIGDKVSEFGIHYSSEWNENQRLVEKCNFDASGLLRKRFKYYYDNQGRLIKEVWEEKKNRPSVTKVYHYLETGLVEITNTYPKSIFFPNGKTFSEVARDGFNSRLLVPRKNIPSSSEERIQQRIRKLKSIFSIGFFKEFDWNNLIFEAGHFKPSGAILSKFLYKLNSDGQIIEEYFEHLEYNIKSKAEYRYDDNGHLQEETHMALRGEMRTTISYSYFFDEMNNWTKVIEISNGKPKYIYLRQIAYF